MFSPTEGDCMFILLAFLSSLFEIRFVQTGLGSIEAFS